MGTLAEQAGPWCRGVWEGRRREAPQAAAGAPAPLAPQAALSTTIPCLHPATPHPSGRVESIGVQVHRPALEGVAEHLRHGQQQHLRGQACLLWDGTQRQAGPRHGTHNSKKCTLWPEASSASSHLPQTAGRRGRPRCRPRCASLPCPARPSCAPTPATPEQPTRPCQTTRAAPPTNSNHNNKKRSLRPARPGQPGPGRTPPRAAARRRWPRCRPRCARPPSPRPRGWRSAEAPAAPRPGAGRRAPGRRS